MSANGSISIRQQGRRDFLKAGGAVAAALLAPGALQADTPKTLPALPSNPRTPAAMPTRNLGKTCYKVGIFSLGGQAALEKPNYFDVAIPIIERALDLGVNYIDTSSIYGGPDVVIGASWDLLPWFAAAGAAFIIVHAAVKAIAGRRGVR